MPRLSPQKQRLLKRLKKLRQRGKISQAEFKRRFLRGGLEGRPSDEARALGREFRSQKQKQLRKEAVERVQAANKAKQQQESFQLREGEQARLSVLAKDKIKVSKGETVREAVVRSRVKKTTEQRAIRSALRTSTTLIRPDREIQLEVQKPSTQEERNRRIGQRTQQLRSTFGLGQRPGETKTLELRDGQVVTTAGGVVLNDPKLRAEQSKPKFFGVTEPSFFLDRERRLDREADIAEQRFIRDVAQGRRENIPLLNKDFLRATSINLINVPTKIANRPISGAATVGAFFLGGPVLGKGAAVTGTQVVGGLSVGKLAIDVSQEQGGVGSRPLGEFAFTAGTIGATKVAGSGLSKLSSRSSRAKFDLQLIQKGKVESSAVASRVTTLKNVLIGKTRPGAKVSGKPFKESFVFKDNKLFRTVDVGKQQLRIVETGNQQFTRTFAKTDKGFKLIGEDFRFIDAKNTLSSNLQAITKGAFDRKILSDVTPFKGATRRLNVLEKTRGKTSSSINVRGQLASIKLKFTDIVSRKIGITPKVVRSQTVKGGKLNIGKSFSIQGGKQLARSTDLITPKVNFGKAPTPKKDLVLFKSEGGLLKLTDITQPRTIETGSFQRTGVGTLTIEKPGFLTSSVGPLIRSKKAGRINIGQAPELESAAAATVEGLETPKPSFKVSTSFVKRPRSQGGLITGSVLGTPFGSRSQERVVTQNIPTFSVSSRPVRATTPSFTTIPETQTRKKFKPTPLFGLFSGLSSGTKSRTSVGIDTNVDIASAVRTSIRSKTKTKTKQRTKTRTALGVTTRTPIRLRAGFKASGLPPSVTVPKPPPFTFNLPTKPRKKAKQVSGKKKKRKLGFTPSFTKQLLELDELDLSKSKFFTGFEFR